MSPSHAYEFRWNAAARALAIPVAMLCGFALLMRAGAGGGVLPRPEPMLDVDRTILVHQARASLLQQPAEIILIGDSSCLMNVSAPQLAETTGRRALNLATLSYVNLPTHAKLVANFLSANHGAHPTIVLLLHPETLRLPARNEYFSQVIHSYLAREDHRAPHLNAVTELLGAEIFRGRLLARALPQPLPGAYGEFYGFSHNLAQFMTAHAGSARDPRRYRPEGSAEYRLAGQIKADAELFRNLLPPGITLAVGLTPVPEDFALPGHAQKAQEILQEFNGWIRADKVLNLPATLTSECFASVTHLNENGMRKLTELLAAELSRR